MSRNRKRPQRPITESKVISEELKQLSRRRREAFGKDQEKTSIEKSRVGLAISGGGVRSGAFGLGFLQGLIEKRFLPFVDYLSTVSGGGYAGSFLSSYSLQQEHHSDSTCQKKVVGDENKSRTFGSDQKRILKLIYSVDYLRHLGDFFNRSVFGALLVLVVGLSGLIFATSLTAFTYQLVNDQTVRFAIRPLGFNSDVTAAFLPPAILVFLWLALWLFDIARRGRKASGDWARPFLYLIVFTVPVAVTLLLGTGDITLETIPAWLGYPVDGLKAQHFSQPLVAAFAGLVFASLLPYLKPKLLIKSGLNPRSTFERASFWLASRALLIGLPLLFVGMFARENLSRKNSERTALLRVQNEIIGWKNWIVDAPFLERFEPLLAEHLADIPYRPTEFEGVESPWSDPTLYTSELPSDVKSEVQLLLRILDKSGIQDDQAPVSGQGPHYKTCEEIYNDLKKVLEHEKNAIERLEVTNSIPEAWANLLVIPFDSFIRDDHLDAGLNPSDVASAVSDTWKRQEAMLNKNPLRQVIERRRRAYDVKLAMLAPINSLLRDPSLYRKLENGTDHNGTKITEITEWKAAKRVAVLFDPTVQEDNVQHRILPSELGKEERYDDLVSANRKLLNAIAGDISDQDSRPHYLEKPEAVFANHVWRADQKTRLAVVFWAGLVFLVSGFAVDLNLTSIHRYYAQRLANAWIEPVKGVGTRIPLALLDTVSRGYPYHLLNGSVYMLGYRNQEDFPEPFDYFLFSQKYCGSERTAFQETGEFMDGEYGLDDAMAISGGAVSVLHLTKNPLLTAILFVLNFRLGQWVENPGYRSILPAKLGKIYSRFSPISPLRVLLSLWIKAEERRLCFVADGGFFDNLGIDALLRRRCKVIITVDASEDPQSEFSDLMRVIRYARMKHRISIRSLDHKGLPFQELIPNAKTSFTKKHFFLGKIEYPDGEDGILIFVKSSMTGDERDELLQYRNRNPEFPHDSTADQAFLPEKFESYRMLGSHVACSVVESLCFDSSNYETVDEMVEALGEKHGIATSEHCELTSLLDSISESDAERNAALAKLEHFVPTDVGEVSVLVSNALMSLHDQNGEQFDRSQISRQILRNRPQAVLPHLMLLLESIDHTAIRNAIVCVGWYLEMGEVVPESIRSKLMDLASDEKHAVATRLKAIQVIKTHERGLGNRATAILDEIAEKEPKPRLARAAKR